MPQRFTVYTDGGARPNPGESAYGLVMFIDGSQVCGHGQYLGPARSNNYAEYKGIIAGLGEMQTRRSAIAKPQERANAIFTLYSDSELAIKQLNGEYRVRKEDLVPLHAEARSLIDQIGRVRLIHVPRRYNALADSLATRARNARGLVKVSLVYSGGGEVPCDVPVKKRRIEGIDSQ